MVDGIINESFEQLKLTSGCPEQNKLIKVAQVNIAKTWRDKIFKKAFENGQKSKFMIFLILSFEILFSHRHKY